MELSIVTTMYYSDPYVEEFYQRITSCAKKITENYEIVFVNDGSPDGCLDTALRLHEKDARVRVVDLSRNFGHHKAMMTGLRHAQGCLIFLIDLDLEEEPELLEAFYHEFRASDCDVVYGVQQARKGGVFERLTGTLFFSLFNLLSMYPIPRNVVVARLMTQRYVAALLLHEEREVVISGLWALTGFEQKPVVVHKKAKGKTTYTLARKVSHLVNAITAFSNKPLVYIFYLGLMITLISGISASYVLIRRLFFDNLLDGWPSVMVSLWFLGGLIVFCLGIIGIYLAKIFTEVKQRPNTIVRAVYSREPETSR